MVHVIFEYAQSIKSTSGWQAKIPLSDLMGIDDGDTACLILKDGHLISLPNGDAYEVAKVIWRPWGLGTRIASNPGSPWLYEPHILVLLHRVGDGVGERFAEGSGDWFLRALRDGLL